ncbi:zinc finger BED domain-containing protein RICESLEEPER 2-like [Bidens hawaiensis]|uniref:zinc finger BED domain-containing protein RICESLEEPER 2-like n=1 Tax=Bidens hawaiensis TaxID=980011 RepID=UPI00404B909A
MALTAHFIDNDWNLVKKVLNFCPLDGHRGVDIGKGVESCLNGWDIDNILTISVDNASANDNAIYFLKIIYANNHISLLHRKWIHIRCAAHILNLVVQDGMKNVDESIENIRYVVKWVKKSGARIEKFKKCAESARCASTKELVLDVPTRWNSTYLMLDVAEAYEHAFYRFDLEDATFGNEIRKKNHLVTTSEDWVKARKLSKIREVLREQLQCDIVKEPPKDQYLYDIAKVMKPKFDKYFGDIDSMNLMLYFALLLDPRNKEMFLDIVLEDHYGMEGKAFVELKKTHIKNGMQEVYDDYVRIHAPPIPFSTSNDPTSSTSHDFGDRLRNKMKASQTSNSSISELDKYLGESVEPFNPNVNFDILT